MARKSKPITANQDQLQELLVMKRSLKIEKRYSQRASIILLSLEHKTLEEIVANTGLSKPIVNSRPLKSN